MNSYTQSILSQLDKSRGTLINAIEHVPADSRERKPSPKAWSVAEILEHLTIIDTRITQLWLMKSATAPKIEGNLATASVNTSRVLDRSFKVDAIEAIRPTGQYDFKSAYSGLEPARQKLREVIVNSDNVDLTNATHVHPLLGEMNLYAWIRFLGAHEERHAAQIREIKPVRE